MEIKTWLQKQISEELGLAPSEISCDTDFAQFNLDSLSLVSLSFELENLVKDEISPTIFAEYNTINKLVEWINRPR